MLTSLDPKSLDAQEVSRMQETAVVWKETTVPQASLHADHTLRTKHVVGQVVHNVHKIFRVLEKSNYMRRFDNKEPPFSQPAPSTGIGKAVFQTEHAKKPKMAADAKPASNSLQGALESGCPATYGKILRYLAFESSSAFVSYLRANGVNLEIQFLIESKFIKELSKFLIDLFKYRVALSPEQFIQKGYTERKMVLVLDLYDLIKQVRNMSKVGHKLNMHDKKFEHPCD